MLLLEFSRVYIIFFTLDHGLNQGQVHNIICTQPRRISAIGVAERVAEERDEKIGNLGMI